MIVIVIAMIIVGPARAVLVLLPVHVLLEGSIKWMALQDAECICQGARVLLLAQQIAGCKILD